MLPLISVPRSELKLSAICLGATAFGPGFPADMAEALYTTFREAGGNCIDMAHCYGNGQVERNLGESIRRHGDGGKFYVIDKGGHPAFPGYAKPDRYLSPEAVASDIAESLDRLQMDKIALYLLHRDDTRVPVGEIIDMLNRHISAGRLSAIGASNWSTGRMAEANAYAARNNLHGFVASPARLEFLGAAEFPPRRRPTRPCGISRRRISPGIMKAACRQSPTRRRPAVISAPAASGRNPTMTTPLAGDGSPAHGAGRQARGDGQPDRAGVSDVPAISGHSHSRDFERGTFGGRPGRGGDSIVGGAGEVVGERGVVSDGRGGNIGLLAGTSVEMRTKKPGVARVSSRRPRL